MTKKTVVSWSGGKDSCLAMYYAVKKGFDIRYLLTMMIDDGSRSRSHGIPPEVLKRQTECIGVRAITEQTSWGDYEEKFINLLKTLKDKGVTDAVFGDIDLEDHREWEEKVCEKANIDCHLPLWLKDRKEIVLELIKSGFKAMIVTIKDEKLNPEYYLGKTLDEELLKDLEKDGVDLCGEEGEYHTIVYDGPIFKEKLNIKVKGILSHSGYSFADLELL